MPTDAESYPADRKTESSWAPPKLLFTQVTLISLQKSLRTDPSLYLSPKDLETSNLLHENHFFHPIIDSGPATWLFLTVAMAETATNHELERSSYIGQTLSDIPTPSAILDLAKLQVNCQRMLDATDKLGLSWRCHIKAHKVSSRVFPRESLRGRLANSHSLPILASWSYESLADTNHLADYSTHATSSWR